MAEYDGSNIPPQVISSLPPVLQSQIPLWHENLQPSIYASLAVCQTLAFVGVALRFYARRLKAQPLWWDDWLIVIALVLNLPFVGVTVTMTYFGTGRHLVYNILNQPELLSPTLEMSVIGAVLNYLPLTFTKLSLLCFYHRIFSAASQRFRWVCIAAGILSACHSLAAILTILLSCVPIQSYWDRTITDGHCINYDFTRVFYSATNVVTDAIILTLPMPTVWRMKTSLSRRVQISGVFLMGSIVTIVSVIRAYYTGRTVLELRSDGSWEASYLCIWANAETGIGILAACLPVMRPVLNRVLYGSGEGTTTRSRSVVKSALSHADASYGAHLMTIGGRVLPVRSEPALPSVGAGPRRASVVSFIVDEKPGSAGPSHESV